MRLFLLISGIFLCVQVAAQQRVTGRVINQESEGIAFASIQVEGLNAGALTDENGQFVLPVPDGKDSVTLKISHISYQLSEIRVYPVEQNITIRLQEKTALLDELKIEGQQLTDDANLTRLQGKTALQLTSPFQDISRVLITLPGVVSNNEFSTTYSVRGGNYDENQIYVNDIPIYRPFLVSNGQQEGLGFVNTDLVKSVDFSAGGWQPKYGDKLSSVLNVSYKDPKEFGASINAGLLGGSAHIENASRDGRLSYIAGVRHKSARYLLNTLETQGQYLPRFTDIQSYITYRVGPDSDKNRTTISALAAYANNRYYVEPESRETEFGNFSQSFRLYVAYDGQETLDYDTYQLGLKATHRISDTWKSYLMTSGVYTTEREYTELEGGYRLCDVDKNLSSDTFNECVYIRGVGTNYDYGRNNLTAELINVENRHVVLLGDNTVEFGWSYSHQLIDDQLQEYAFIDSADYVINLESQSSTAELASNQYAGFGQLSTAISKRFNITAGARVNYWDLNEEWLFSPRVQADYKPEAMPATAFHLAAGLYQQPPFYREMRGFDGRVNTNLKAQKSWHLIAGMTRDLIWWARPFVLDVEAYYKSMYDMVPYEIENVKLRYYANNEAKAYATGLDFRLSGEFIDGVESWFSLGVLSTKEDVAGDGQGYIRRPTDQRVNLAIFFQDHFPNNPDMRVSLTMLYGSGLPFGPPNDFARRNSYKGGDYTRVDVGFARIFHLNKEKGHLFTIRAEVLNLLGKANPISYTWISDVTNNQYAVPNSLSARFLNLRAILQL